MSQETEYFQGRSTDEDHERCYRRRIGFMLFALFALALILAPLVGCATPEEQVWQRVCYEQLLGQDERGLYVVRHFCVKEEPK